MRGGAGTSARGCRGAAAPRYPPVSARPASEARRRRGPALLRAAADEGAEEGVRIRKTMADLDSLLGIQEEAPKDKVCGRAVFRPASGPAPPPRWSR